VLIFVATAVAVFCVLTFAAWRRHPWAAEKVPQADTCQYSLTDVFGDAIPLKKASKSWRLCHFAAPLDLI
jgi:hypothetical protein